MSTPFCKILKIILVFIVEHAVAITLKIGIRDLLPELLANALILFRALEPARTITTGAL